jgi:hypothetical protein
MKKIARFFTPLLFVLLFSTISAGAQTMDTNPSVLKTSPANITIDGNLNDWNDSLQYYNAETNIRYTFSNDKEYLYFAARIDDPHEIDRVLKAGITLNIDPKGKKKTAFGITFPVNSQIGNFPSQVPPNSLNGITQANRDELLREAATTLRGIKVEGFKDIDGDMITTSNTYGIKTAINYDEKGSLVCEAAIALKLLHIDGRSKTEWLYAVKINAPVHSPEAHNNDGGGGRGGMGGGGGGRGGMSGGGGGMGGGSGGMGGGGRGGRGGGGAAPGGAGNEASLKAIDFSGKFVLSNPQ